MPPKDDMQSKVSTAAAQLVANQKSGASFSERPAVKRAMGIIFSFLHENKLIKEGDSLLDVGMGAGIACLALAEKFRIHCRGVTIDKDDLALAESRGVSCKQADMHSLPHGNAQFDIVWASHVLEHSFAPLAALEEWKRVLKTGGKIILWGPIGRDFKGENDGSVVWGCKDHILTPTEWQYKWLFHLANLKLTHQQDIPYQIRDDAAEIRYIRKRRLLRLLRTFGLTLLPEKVPGTAHLYVLEK